MPARLGTRANVAFVHWILFLQSTACVVSHQTNQSTNSHCCPSKILSKSLEHLLPEANVNDAVRRCWKLAPACTPLNLTGAEDDSCRTRWHCWMQPKGADNAERVRIVRCPVQVVWVHKALQIIYKFINATF